MKNIKNTSLNATENANEIEYKIEQLIQENEELKARVRFFEEHFKLTQSRMFEPSSEKISSDQISFFNEAEKESAKDSTEPDLEEITYKRKKATTKSRKSYKELEEEEVLYTLPAHEQNCPCCNNALHEMKVIVRKELKIIPPTAKVVLHKRQVYACRHCDSYHNEGSAGSIVVAPMPNPVLPGSMVSPSLLSTIMDMKYNKMMPLYRQEQSFIDYGIDISRQNMASWVIKGAEKWLTPLFHRMHHYLLKESIIHADETVLNCLDEKDNKNNYMWLYATGEHAIRRIFLYDYQKSRANRHPSVFLKGFAGYLQTDGYTGYNKVEKVTRLGCLAHARRYHTDALKALPKEAQLSKSKANEALRFFTKIYKFEASYKGLSPDRRYHKRIEEVKPILEDYRHWLDEEVKKTLPKSKLGEAIKYSLNQWETLIIFLEDGRLSCDNNLAERAIKPFVLGRKNFLFAKSPKGATASGICYSIIETAKANGLIPYQYLNYLFEMLPNIDLDNHVDLDACLPWSETLPEIVKRKIVDTKSENQSVIAS